MKKAKIVISTRTWPRDTYDLFDYECSTTISQSYFTSSTCYLLRSGNTIDFLEKPQDPIIKKNSLLLATIQKELSNFSIQKSVTDLWLVVKSLDQGYDLEENNVIKLGRVKIRVKFLESYTSITNPESNENTSGHACKICLSEDDSKENPLISPCSCIGSMKYIHYSCLKTWFNTKIQKTINQNSICYYWRNIDCEICKKPFNGVNELFEKGIINDKGKKCLILESVDKDKSNLRGMHLIQFNDNEMLKLGRGHESHIKLYDISVSRFHASIEYCDGKFVLKDNQSKFGTLVGVHDKFDVVEDVVMQSGRTTVALRLDYSGDSSTSED